MIKRLLPIFILISSTTFGQGFVNGSFELTTSTGCDYNNGIAEFNSVMDNVEMFSGTEIDIIEAGCYVPTIPDGVKGIAMARDPLAVGGSDGVNMELDVALVSGLEYELTFWAYSNPSQPNGGVEIGCTEDSGIMGEIVETTATTPSTWVLSVITFVAPNNATHISVRNEQDATHWNFVDEFNIELSCVPIEIVASETELCFDEELVLTATGEGTVTWEDGIVNGEEFIPESTGVITYTVTSDADGDCPTTIEIEVFELPEVIATVDEEVICLGDTIVLTGSGTATEYVWDPLEVIDGALYTPAADGSFTYTVTGTDDNGCEDEDEITVTINALPEVTAEVSDDEICLGEEVVFTGSGALTYVWDPAAVVDGEAYVPAETGTYTVLGVDDNGCENSASVDITVYPALEITYIVTDEIFGADGEIDISVTGGNPAYVFDWDTDGTGDFDDDEDLTDLIAGTYIVVVEDDAGCTATVSVDVDGQVGLNEANLQVLVYPNPTKGDVNIVYAGTFSYSLSAIDGAQLMNGTASNSAIISLENYATGVYYITLIIDGTRAVYKLIKQ
ncbi:MAG: T9SS type A sorting domain-containing protein [Crocinitomix sp.]|nr:T9SS type A sorting domain-containing protein [Crocinitomix sp.]